MSFELEGALQAANEAVNAIAGRPLSDVETLILKGSWERLDYDQIAAQNQYATTYVSNDIAPKLWKLLTDALGEKVKKSNFKAALERYWEESQATAGEPGSDKDTNSFMLYENYILRPPIERICCETVLKPGSLLRIKAPQYMGKTSLVNWLIAQISAQSYRTVNLSFELADRRKHFSDLNQFLRWFCLYISRELGLPGALEDYWDEEGMGAKVSCTTYFEEYLLPEANAPLLLCLDDVDLLFPYPEIYEDFFGLLRSWYEKARSRRVWQNLRLVLVHATDVYIRLNIHQSPFNVGVPVGLPDFTAEQAEAFAESYGVGNSAATVTALMPWLAGHPYLLQLAFRELTTRSPDFLTKLLAEIATESGIYSAHLREYLLSLQAEPALAQALYQVITAQEPIKLEAIAAYKLQSMGLVSLSGNVAQPRCQLYRVYFAEHLREAIA